MADLLFVVILVTMVAFAARGAASRNRRAIARMSEDPTDQWEDDGGAPART